MKKYIFLILSFFLLFGCIQEDLVCDVVPEKLTLEIGETAVVKGMIGKDVVEAEWRSTDAETVSVDSSGKVTAKRLGTADVFPRVFVFQINPCTVSVPAFSGTAEEAAEVLKAAAPSPSSPYEEPYTVTVTGTGIFPKSLGEALKNPRIRVKLVLADSQIVRIRQFAEAVSLVEVSLPKVTEIEEGAFADCFNLKSVSLPAVDLLGGSVFENCRSLTSVSLPALTQEIGNAAFRGCTALKEVILPEKGTFKLIHAAFHGCTALERINLESAAFIGNDCFALDEASDLPLETGTLSGLDSSLDLSYNIFSNRVLNRLSCPNLTAVGDSAFVSLTVLEEASFPSATTVNANAFTDAVIPVLKLTYPGKITVTDSFAAAGSFQPADTVLYLDESNSSEISDGNTWQSVSWKEIRTVSGETP